MKTPCTINNIRVIYFVQKYDHYTVDEIGDGDVITKEIVGLSQKDEVYPYYCKNCSRCFDDWATAKQHLEQAKQETR